MFRESNTIISYDGITLTSAVPGVEVTVGTSAAAVINQVATCTRYQINAQGVTIKGLLFDQSMCVLTGTMQQTPIVFSGQYAVDASVTDITVRDATVAVAVLGADSLVFGFSNTINADGMVLHNIRFEYTPTSPIPIDQRRVVGAFGQTVGVVVATDCSQEPPPGVLGGNYAVTTTCGIEFVPWAVDNACALPSECARDPETTGSNGCCGPPLIDPVYAPMCEFGLMCAGDMKKINSTLSSQPNSRVFCTAERCGCSAKNTGRTEPCIVTESASTCFYNRELCYSYCGGEGSHRQHYTLGPNMTLTPLGSSFYQEWMYDGAGR
jgi:hypothetical protein